MTKPTLQNVLEKYQSHPDFIGIKIDGPNCLGALDDTPLHIAARKGELEDVEILIEHGAEINLAGDIGNTPLHHAALTGRVAVAQKLLAHGADTSARNVFSETPLVVAIQGGHDAVADLLRNR